MCLDSGPLTAIVNGKVTVVGVVSFGGVNCPVNLPSAYARVSFQKDWILANSDAADWQCNGTNSTVTPGLDLRFIFHLSDSLYLNFTTSAKLQTLSEILNVIFMLILYIMCSNFSTF
jgi:hypothetical protein